MIEKVHGVVLRAENLGEHDQRLTLYTRELGKIKAKITGVKKTLSKLRALAAPFSESRFQIYMRGTKRAGPREPGKVIGGEPLEYHLILRDEWPRMMETSAWCEILDALTRPGYPNHQEYALLSSALIQMENSPSPILVRLRSTLVLLKILGYSMIHHPAWKNCPEKEKVLVRRLAKWNSSDESFPENEVQRLETIVHSYLELYLDEPLQTLIFRKKIAQAGVWSNDYLKINMASPKL